MLSPAGARVVTEIASELPVFGWLRSPAGARDVTSVQLVLFRWFIVTVPRRGASCYRWQQPNRQVVHLLSPAGARVVTVQKLVNKGFLQGCCPPQGRELLRGKMYDTTALFQVAVPRRGESCYGNGIDRSDRHCKVAVPRRGASCYSLLTILIARSRSCCPPQGRELLRPDGQQDERRGELLSPAGARVVTLVCIMRTTVVPGLLSPAGARVVTAKMRKIQCGFSAFLQSFCIIFCIFAYPFVILSVFSGANLPVTTLFIVIIPRASHQINLCCTSGVSACTVKATAHN